ncbi:twin-arginine translocase TatA/TatE family subunit [Thiorhodococcus mannitoliphagus]|uniref:Sec-independent protein translocase protein TatA n=1 Tax=Thiorhodococcus mannitoliphagus TaxID=329406 RepID=A0A6P1DVA5_9GAMM|nr:twin-arginine translocase TatA/TatE family subunit [Thiorhodococcus mannitoliphagus]NEX21410.1 twin-arginine translocase TatA/TatE family subunit [Thiorhodococcus mannitoliphagus]
MGVGGISIWQLLIILVIVLLLFGTKRLKGIGSDLGEAIRGFRSSMANSDKDEDASGEPTPLGRADAQRSGGTDAPAQGAKQESTKTSD